AVVVMGVSGAGKTTVGRRLAQALGVDFVEGDDLHSPEARAKMAAGHPLTDDDRRPWLDRIGARLADELARGRGVVVACSALRGAYRDRLRAAAGARLRFVHIAADPEAMRARLAARKGHFMPASLVDSQFATLEDPSGEPDVLTVPADGDLAEEIPALVAALGRVP
ncbi:MAG: gluconokinase, partial [Hyphomicrobiales bacterium]|nr:gluconokinase [Hyphomicrobiales bacterium]